MHTFNFISFSVVLSGAALVSIVFRCTSRGLEVGLVWTVYRSVHVQSPPRPSSYFNAERPQTSTVVRPSAHGRSCSFRMFRSSADLHRRSWNNLISAVLFHSEFAELNPGRKRSLKLGGCIVYSTQLSNVPKMAFRWDKLNVTHPHVILRLEKVQTWTVVTF